MFGHHSLSETSFATDPFSLFFTPTGVSGTGAPGTTAAKGSANILVEGVFAQTGNAPILDTNNSLVTFESMLSAISSNLNSGVFAEETSIDLQQKLSASTLEGGILFQGTQTDVFLTSFNAATGQSNFAASDSISAISGQNNQGRATFGQPQGGLNFSGVGTTLQGVSATGEIGEATVWGIFLSTTTSYSTVSSSQSPSFSVVSPNQSPNFNKITPSQSPSYSPVTPSQNPTWE